MSEFLVFAIVGADAQVGGRLFRIAELFARVPDLIVAVLLGVVLVQGGIPSQPNIEGPDENVWGVLAAPPCEHFSKAKHFHERW